MLFENISVKPFALAEIDNLPLAASGSKTSWSIFDVFDTYGSSTVLFRRALPSQ